jgi:hypothetical protein
MHEAEGAWRRALAERSVADFAASAEREVPDAADRVRHWLETAEA